LLLATVGVLIEVTRHQYALICKVSMLPTLLSATIAFYLFMVGIAGVVGLCTLNLRVVKMVSITIKCTIIN